MAIEVQGEIKLYVLQETELTIKDFLTKFHKDNIIETKLQFVLSDGSIHALHVCDLLEGIIKSFIVDGEDMTNEIKELVTKSFETKIVANIAI